MNQPYPYGIEFITEEEVEAQAFDLVPEKEPRKWYVKVLRANLWFWAIVWCLIWTVGALPFFLSVLGIPIGLGVLVAAVLPIAWLMETA